ncbi:hypothetical protein [Candidatus Poriferisodalis sp.]|uniref:hypothetical protein n=1 Tax=Candidatus Poriferisodalis sp. TaxID=3101277 RepID=UPI003B02EC0F
MDELTLARYEAQGNDFLIALLTERELRDLDASLDAGGLTRSDVARVVCGRHRGLGSQRGHVHSKGADGFVLGVHKATDERWADRIRMHLLNADGSVAETSGNGLACLAMASFDARIIGTGPSIPFDTDAGEQRCSVLNADSARLVGPAAPIRAGDLAQRRSVEVAMNPVGPGPEIPCQLEERIRGTFGGDLFCLGTGSVGNPHLVIALARPPIGCDCHELDDRAEELAAAVSKLGRIYESYFSTGINVEFVWPYSSHPLQPEQAWALQMSVWERGAGLTVSCGSGSVVAATLAHRWGFARSPNDVPNTAGDGGTEAHLPSTYRVNMRTAPFPGNSGSGFDYWVLTVPEHLEAFNRPQLIVEAERIETGLTMRLDQTPLLLDDLVATTESKR